jgi:Type IV pilin-like G and H, putative
MVQSNTQNEIPDQSLPEKSQPKRTFRQFVSNPTNIVTGVVGLVVAAYITAPSFLNQSSQADQSVGRLELDQIAGVQQLYFIENSKFATRISDFGPNIFGKPSKHYMYEILDSGSKDFQQIVAIATTPKLKSHTAVLRKAYSSKLSKEIFVYNLCEGITAESKISLITEQQAQRSDVRTPLCPANFRAHGEVQLGRYGDF